MMMHDLFFSDVIMMVVSWHKQAKKSDKLEAYKQGATTTTRWLLSKKNTAMILARLVVACNKNYVQAAPKRKSCLLPGC